jgi:hypothetical protein
MGNKTTDKRRRRLRAVLPIAAALMMLLATAPGVGAQEAPGGFPTGTAPEVELDPAEVSTGDALGVCSHAAGEFLVGYTSEEAFRAAPTENVVGTFPEILAHHLAFPEVAGGPASEEAKRQELAAQPGVAYAEYNCTEQVNQAAAPEAAPKAASAPPPAICANCGNYVVEKARKILDESEGKDAYDAALDAARTTDGNVALATEEDADSGGGSDTGARSEEVGSEEASGSEGSSESRESSDSEEDPAGSGEDSAFSDTEAEPEEEAAGVDTEPISQRNVLSGGLRETASSPSILVLGTTGVLLLAAGLFVARRTLGK